MVVITVSNQCLIPFKIPKVFCFLIRGSEEKEEVQVQVQVHSSDGLNTA